MGNSLRAQPWPSKHGELKTPFRNDSLQIGLLFSFGIIALSFILIIPGIRGWERLWASIRVFAALWIGAVLLVSNYGSWYSGSVCSRTQYKAHTAINTPQIIQASIGLSIQLRGINITLVQTECFEGYQSPFLDEEINYNEKFYWSNPWNQGRRDFGEFGGRFNQEYRAAKYRGMPIPITQIAEHFIIDGEQFVWYRKFRMVGWYTHICLWTGFATYLLSILLFIHNVRHGAYHMLITGLLLLLAALIYGVVIQNDPPLHIHFPDGILIPDFDYSFWLTLWTGVLTCIFAVVILIADKYCPRKIASFFHHAIILDDTIFLLSALEDEEELKHLPGIIRMRSKRRSCMGVKEEFQHKDQHSTYCQVPVTQTSSTGEFLIRIKLKTTIDMPVAEQEAKESRDFIEWKEVAEKRMIKSVIQDIEVVEQTVN